jgi:hypothetical protein
MSNPDFPSAASRHLRDAKAILSESPDNALYLAGYTAECSLKAVIELCGVHAPAFGHRLEALRDEGFGLAIAMAPAAARYRPRASTVQAIRMRWSQNMRYDSTGDTDKEQAKEFVDLVDEIFQACVVEMFLDGMLKEMPR